MIRGALVALAVLCASCATGPKPVPAGTAPGERVVLAEQALLADRPYSAQFEVTATGALEARLSGTLRLAAPNTITLAAEGIFAGAAVNMALDTSGALQRRSFSKGAVASAVQEPIGAFTREAVVLGLVRMGVLHTLARLVEDKGVDHADTGATTWVQAADARAAAPLAPAGPPSTCVEFQVVVAALRTGQAVVCTEDATGLPVFRRQTVEFEAGEMQVEERFTWSL